MIKCPCGYEARLPGESEMIDQWGCAKAIVRRSGPFNSLEVITCSAGTGEPEPTPIDNGEALKEAFAKKYDKPDNGSKK